MQRYHVDIDYDGRILRDIYGVSLMDDAEARSHALLALTNSARRHKSGAGAQALRVSLRNGKGKVIYGATLWLRGENLAGIPRSA